MLADARRRADDPSGAIAAARAPLSPVPGKPALLSLPSAVSAGGMDETVGPPFYNRAYVVSVAEKNKESLTRRFTTEAFNAFDADGDGLLNTDEFASLVRGFYSDLRLRPAHGLAARLWESTESLDREAFNAVFAELHKGVVFKIRVAGTEEGGNSPRPLTPGGPMVRSECQEFPIGLQVEVASFRRCHPQSAAAAKKLRLRRFQAAEDRLPPRSGLEVVGSFLHTGDPSEGISHGEYVVGIRDESGQEFLIDSRGLRREELSEEERSEAGEGRRRGREVAAELGQCLTVQQVSHFFEHGHRGRPITGRSSICK